MKTTGDYCEKIIILGEKKWVVYVQSVMNQILKSMTLHHQEMIFDYLRLKGTITLRTDKDITFL